MRIRRSPATNFEVKSVTKKFPSQGWVSSLSSPKHGSRNKTTSQIDRKSEKKVIRGESTPRMTPIGIQV